MDHRLTPQQQDALMEDALKSYPLAPMPKDITVKVMARIQKDKRPALVTWNDLAISLTVAVCIGALFFTLQNLPPIIFAEIRMQSILLYQDWLVNSRWLIPLASVALGIILLFFALFNLQGEGNA